MTLCLFYKDANGQGYLKASGASIVDEKGNSILLRGIGLGGWMLQEGYMLKLPQFGQQHVIKQKIEALMGPEKTKIFYDSWMANFTTKADIDSLKAWGFNSVRLPMHYNLYTPAIEDEPVKGENTWINKGFEMTDSLLAWCKANNLYLILDLHAAPGGQGNDLPIADRDPNNPSLWESEANQQKTVALWKKLAERYANEPAIAGYDIINEPNWDFEKINDKNGLKQQHNEPLKKLLIDITKAIREVDEKHLIIIEGNGWGINYNGILPVWDNNMALSFHKYWNFNDEASIRYMLDIRKKHQIPVWLGETGENSNTWFTEAIRLFERNDIGWCWWPLKKMGINNPLEIKIDSGYQTLLNYWNGDGLQPKEEEAYSALMQQAANTNARQCVYHKDVIDAMFRQVKNSTSISFKENRIEKWNVIYAADYDLGSNKIAYFDKDAADYHASTGSDWIVWNRGNFYRNDGVDILIDTADTKNENKYFVAMSKGEWLKYTIDVTKAGSYDIDVRTACNNSRSTLSLLINDNARQRAISVPFTAGNKTWKVITIDNVPLHKGKNTLQFYAPGGDFDFRSFDVTAKKY